MKNWLKIVIIISLGGMALYHILPYSNTYTNILYYVSDHGLKLGLLIYLYLLYKSDELLFASIYIGLKLFYHLALFNKGYAEYLGAIKSELIASILTILLLIYFIYKHEKMVRYKLNNKNNS